MGHLRNATFIALLLDANWDVRTGVVEPELIKTAAARASAAAALVLDRVEFGFPSTAQVDEALYAGRV